MNVPFHLDLYDLLNPVHELLLRCETCGDTFFVKYHDGNFGPRLSSIEGPTVIEHKVETCHPILCAHCGHEEWASEAQALLRRAAKVQTGIEDLLDGSIKPQVRQDHERRLHAWAELITLEHFRALDGAWFSHLWEGAPFPAGTLNPPAQHVKKIRFFLFHVAKTKAMSSWPQSPAGEPGLQGAIAMELKEHQKLAEGLATALRSMGQTRMLMRSALLWPLNGSGFQGTQPQRGITTYCYHPDPVDGPALANKLLTQANPELDSLCGVFPKTLDPRSRLLRDRLDMLLHHNGLARTTRHQSC